jgi:ParB family chromosome partitioning protein
MTTTATMIDIPLNRLILWDGNVRKTAAETGLDELAASIAAHGLLNPLTVRKAAKGRYAIVAGQRRYLAMKQLAEAGALTKAAPVSCRLAEAEQDGVELSLAENVMRVAMHPADQFEAWRGLIDKGASVPEIAARFGAAESTVRKRLALARVSPRLFDLYRAGTVSLDILQAFTLTDDHALQESVWEGLQSWQRDNPRAIRQALTETDVPCHDRRVRFVGLDAYEAAGGPVRRDLFDPQGGGYAQDAARLDAMALQKLEAVAATVQAEGWAWVEPVLSFGWEQRHEHRQLQPEDAPVPEAVQEEADRLAAEYDELCDADDEAAQAQRTAIEARLDAIEALARVWPDETKAVAGAVVTLSADGTVEIVRGLLRDGDALPAQPSSSDEADDDTAAESGDAPALPFSLIEDLTAQRTAALRIELARSPDTALAVVTHRLAGSVFYSAGGGILKARIDSRDLRRSIREHEACPALRCLEAERERLGDLLPGDAADLLPWCLAADRDTLLDVLAVAAAHGLDAVTNKSDPNHGGAAEGTALTEALRLDMAQWYRVTAAGYFGRVSKATILADLAEARQAPNAPSWEKMKKGELADLAERETAKTAWLPALLR